MRRDKEKMENIKKEKVNTISKKKMATIILIAIFIIASTVVVYAYLTHRATVKNTIKLGYSKIQINENYVPPLSMDKGISFTKEPYVTNTGTVDCYVRVKSVISDSRVAEYITIDYNETDFTYNAQDGYWYYKEAIAPGARTSSLFTTVSIAEDADDIVLDGFDIYVYAECVETIQSKTMDEAWDYHKN